MHLPSVALHFRREYFHELVELSVGADQRLLLLLQNIILLVFTFLLGALHFFIFGLLLFFPELVRVEVQDLVVDVIRRLDVIDCQKSKG